jgi:hypothetical protein
MVAIEESLWRSVLVSHRAAILASLTKELRQALRDVGEIRAAIEDLKR